MSIKTTSKKANSRAHHVEKEAAKSDESETQAVVEVSEAEKQANVPKEPPPAPVFKPADTIEKSAETAEKPAAAPAEAASVATPSINQSDWSEWIWDSNQDFWYRAKKTPDGAWQYECTEPITSPQYAQPTRIVYPNQKEKVLFASECIHEVSDSRGGYLLAVREEEKLWDVEEALKASAKAKVDIVKADGKKTGGETEKKGEGEAVKKVEEEGEKKTPTSGALGKGHDPAAGKSAEGVAKVRKVIDAVPVGPEETSSKDAPSKKKSQKAEKDPSPKTSKKQHSPPKKKKDAKRKSRLKTKAVYFEDKDEDEEDHDSGHRGRARERGR